MSDMSDFFSEKEEETLKKGKKGGAETEEPKPAKKKQKVEAEEVPKKCEVGYGSSPPPQPAQQAAPKKPQTMKFRSSLQPSLSSRRVNTFAGPDTGATFAVWNLWDLGGGPGSGHWTEQALIDLPGELEKIDADVLGLLEIKTGIAWEQLPKPKLPVVAFEIGAMTAVMFKLVKMEGEGRDPTRFLRTIKQYMWTGEDKYLTAGLDCVINFEKFPLLQDGFKVVSEDLNNIEQVLKDMSLGFADYLHSKAEEMYKLMHSSYSKAGNNTQSFQENGSYKQITSVDRPSKSSMRKALFATFKHVQRAFSNAGVVAIAKAKPKIKEANGIELIRKVLNDFIDNLKEKNKKFGYCIINEAKGDGETTAFVFNTDKFDYKDCGSMPIRGEAWRFRSAGYVLLTGTGALPGEDVLVVAWHAPSENHVGNRKQAYSTLRDKIKDKLIEEKSEAEVILLADMNIRANPALCEEGIVNSVYKNWLPHAEAHMEFCTSLKMTGSKTEQWNHPFDKVLLLNAKGRQTQYKIGKYGKMSDSRGAKDIRKFSDYSWVKAKISLDASPSLSSSSSSSSSLLSSK